MPTSEQNVSMRDLLASCAAASAVSTPPGTADADQTPAPGVGDVLDARETNSAADRTAETAPERRRAA
ncbi:hypothetical protein [Streptomyces ficellus]|uniref:Uncharacterized protein n=1 Tax=Streptomyces ficellus TaxID=1977088 RepID=A0A6I6FQV0_9ACTN|nr:hypothetical protein [Streptomyces ficellus]QGV79026.1 hypothetical protein EIZ62_12785 [Streptomyces ficellus]